MQKLIDVDALIKECNAVIEEINASEVNEDYYDGYDDGVNNIKDYAKHMPTIDAKRGEWISYSPCTCICSVCAFIVSDWFVSKFRYCPNCGARMDEE